MACKHVCVITEALKVGTTALKSFGLFKPWRGSQLLYSIMLMVQGCSTCDLQGGIGYQKRHHSSTLDAPEKRADWGSMTPLTAY